jgi:transketolase
MLPGMRVIAPADHAQARRAILATWDLPGPTYYRLGKDDRTLVPGLDGRFALGRAQWIREGSDVLLIAMGGVAVEAAAAADRLAADGVSPSLVVVASVSPPPVDDLVDALARHSVAVTVEAHAASGGVGSLVSELIAERGLGCRVVRAGVRSRSATGGGPAFLHRLHGLDREEIAAAARRARRERQS